MQSVEQLESRLAEEEQARSTEVSGTVSIATIT